MPNWKNNINLFRADVQTFPDNAKLNAFYGMELRDKAMIAPSQQESQRLLAEAEQYFNKALEIYPQHTDARYNLGSRINKQVEWKKPSSNTKLPCTIFPTMH